MLIDSHAHLYSEEFDDDRNEAIKRASDAGIKKIILPNIDRSSIPNMLELADQYPEICYPLMGLHPGSVTKDYIPELTTVENWLGKRKFYGIGEIGIDLYWEKTFQKQQEDAFSHQIQLAKALRLPVVIHVRNSFDEVYRIIEKEAGERLRGIFHCFTGHLEEARKIIQAGFKLGIGGVITFRNSHLKDILPDIDPGHLVLETDSPYLTPVPYRGKRNESAYLPHIAKEVARVYSMDVEELATLTSDNVTRLFRL
jgi:TatD DNase family protein